EDLDRLAASPLLLEFVLRSLCSATQPAVSVAKLKTKVDAKLKKPFEEAVKRRIADNALPPTVAVLQTGRTKQLHWVAFPLPRPAEVVLAENLVSVLRAQRHLGAGAYPVRLKRLLELTDPRAKSALVKKALAAEAFQHQAVLALKTHPDSPVALLADLEALAG